MDPKLEFKEDDIFVAGLNMWGVLESFPARILFAPTSSRRYSTGAWTRRLMVSLSESCFRRSNAGIWFPTIKTITCGSEPPTVGSH